MIPKPHHKQFNIDWEASRKRFTRHKTSGEDISFFTAVKALIRDKVEMKSTHLCWRRIAGCLERTFRILQTAREDKMTYLKGYKRLKMKNNCPVETVALSVKDVHQCLLTSTN